MALLGFLKQKKKGEVDLPPPPKSPKKEESFEKISGIPDIRADEEQLPEFPSLSAEDLTAELPVEIPDVSEKRVEEPVVFDKTVRVVESVPEVVRKPVGVQKTFVSMDDYAKIMQSADVIRERLNESESLIRRLNELRAEETKTVEGWLAQLEDVEKKLANVDKVLAKAHV
ncbi:hypothetical protein HY484_03445 [Candidatus Woesearchaeota archaeon]|nr:hypothetical protein [Candidatus Woesearchaeota archaeon]